MEPSRLIPPTSTIRKYRYRLRRSELGLEEIAEVEYCFEGPGLVHHHPDWQVLIQLEGGMRVRSGASELTLGLEQLCVIPPGMRHSVHASTAGPRGAYLDLRVGRDGAGPLLEHVERLGRSDLKVWRCPPDTVPALAGDLRRTILQGTTPDAADLLGPVWCLLRRSDRPDLPPGAWAGGSRDVRVQSTVTLMQDLLGADLPIQDMAQRVHLSTSQLNRLFHQELGVGPAAYLRGLRLERARQLLRASTLSIKQISQECGFQNPQAFARAFRRQFEESPSRYRRSHG